MRGQKGSSALIIVIVVLVVIILVALYLAYGNRLTNRQPSTGKPTSQTTQSGSYLQEKYENPFDEKSQYSNPFDEGDSYSNPFDQIQ